MDEQADRLYELPLEDFTAERDALAKGLRADKRRDEADAVKALRKPSVAAWAVNQVLRGRPTDQRALLEAADALRAAQKDLLAGKGDAAAVRKATEAERKAVDRLVTAASGLTHGKGFLNDSVLDRVRETLRSVATDDEARAEVEAARVTRERRPAAFGGLEGFAAAAPRSTKQAPATKPATKRGRAARGNADDKERQAQERARRKEAQAELKEARAEEKAAARRRREAEKAVNAAENDLAGARSGLEAAEADERVAAERRAAAEHALADSGRD